MADGEISDAEMFGAPQQQPAPQQKEISDAEMFGSGQAPQAVPGDNVSQTVFKQSAAGTFFDRAMGVVTRPLQAGKIAVEDAMTEGGDAGLSDETVKSLKSAGIFNDYSKGQFGFMQAVAQGILQPAAFAADVALRDVNAVATGAAAVAGGILNEARGNIKSPDVVAHEASDFTNYLYISAGISPNGVPAAVGPSLKYMMSLPRKAEEAESGIQRIRPLSDAEKTESENGELPDARPGYAVLNDDGEKIGRILTHTGENGDTVVNWATAKEENRGKGLFTDAYSKLADEAIARGNALSSDSVVSPDAKRIYDALEKRGYIIEKSPLTREGKYGAEVTGNGTPVYRVIGKAESAQEPQLITKAPVDNPMVDKESGNLNLKYIKADSDVQGILARSAQAVADRDGVVISNSTTAAKGQALLDKAMAETADGIPPELSNRMRGDPTNEVQLYAARALVKQAGDEVFKLGQIAQQTGDARDYAALEDSYDRLMTLNGIRHDISATVGRSAQSHQIVIGSEEAAQKISGMSKEDAMRTAMTLPDQQAVAKFVDTMKKPGWSDMAIFHYISFLLSNPVTHAAYAAFGEVQTALRAGVESTVAVGVGAVRRAMGSALSPEEYSALQTEREGIESRLRDADAGIENIKASESGQLEMRLKEIKDAQKAGESHMPAEIAGRFFGVGKGQVDGLRAAGRAMIPGNSQMFPGEEAAAQDAMKKAEAAALEEGKTEQEAKALGEAEYRKAAPQVSNPIMERAQYIKSPLFKGLVSGYGRVLGVFPTVAGAIHTFQKFSAYTESMYAQAYRRAALMGEASDEEMAARIAKHLGSPDQDMMKQAAEDGKYASLVNKPGIHGQNLETFAHTSAWTRFVVPFARIATNLTSQSLLERTPAGLMSEEIRARLFGARGGIAQEDAIARMAVGTGIVSAGAWLTSRGLVNGVGPTKPADRAHNFLVGRPELSARLGDHFVPLRLLGLPGRIISYGAAAHEVFQGFTEGDDLWDSTGHMIMTVADTALQENALKGLADFLDAVVGHDVEMSKRYALNAVTTAIVPRGVAQWTRLEDPYMRSTMGNGFMERLQKTIDSQLPWESQSLFPQVDVYGRDMLRNYDPEAAMKDPVAQAEIAAHQYPTKVESRINNVRLTDSQYYQYQKTAGAIYHAAVQQLIDNDQLSNIPVDAQADMLRKAMTDSRATARQQMLLNDPKLAESVAAYTQKLAEKKSEERGY